MPGSEILESVVPRSIIIGNSILGKIPQVIKSLRFKPKIMVLSGKKTRQIVGEEIHTIIEDNDIDFDSLTIENSSLEAAISYKEEVERYNPNIIISAGGGKVIDVGKYCTIKSDQRVELISIPTSTPH
ncbi:MAG: iron-containing alcohol dehydrogenase, partial [Candidatus Hodarchaeales archaeon]